MRSGAAVLRDEAEHLVEVEGRGVSRSQVACDQHERLVAHRHAGGRHAAQLCDDTLSDVVEVGGALGHVAAECDQHLLELAERLLHCEFGVHTSTDARGNVVCKGRVLRHQGSGLQHILRLASHCLASRHEVARDLVQRIRRPLHLAFGVALKRRIGRWGEPVWHPQCLACSDSASYAYSVQL